MQPSRPKLPYDLGGKKPKLGPRDPGIVSLHACGSCSPGGAQILIELMGIGLAASPQTSPRMARERGAAIVTSFGGGGGLCTVLRLYIAGRR
jgi:hypothetical protein